MYSCSSIRNNVQFKTYLPLLPPDVRDSSAVVYGPTFSCPSMSGPPAAPNPLSLVCSLEPLFSQERCIHRRNDPALCYRHSELVCITSKNTSHHITSHHTSHRTSHHKTSQHFVHFVAKCVHRVTKLHFVVTLESKRKIS